MDGIGRTGISFVSAALASVLFFVLVFPAQAVSGERHIAKKKCAPMNLSNKGDEYYTGPIIDTHLHMPAATDGAPNPEFGKNVNIKRIVCTLRAEGTRKAFSFFPVYVGEDEKVFLKKADKILGKYPKLFVPFLMPPGKKNGTPTVNARNFKKYTKSRRKLFKGYGEISLTTQVTGDSTKWSPSKKILRDIYKVLKKRKMAVYLHPGVNHQEALGRMLDKYPTVNFIVHGEQVEEEGPIGDLMDDHPNLYFTVNDLYGDQYLLHPDEDVNSFLKATADYAPLLQIDVDNWKSAIEAHPNQFLWGTDRGGVSAWTFNKKVGRRLVDYGRTFIGQLDPAVQKKFAYKNAERLLK